MVHKWWRIKPRTSSFRMVVVSYDSLPEIFPRSIHSFLISVAVPFQQTRLSYERTIVCKLDVLGFKYFSSFLKMQKRHKLLHSKDFSRKFASIWTLHWEKYFTIRSRDTRPQATRTLTYFWIGSKKIWDARIHVEKTLSCTVIWCSCLCLIK